MPNVECEGSHGCNESVADNDALSRETGHPPCGVAVIQPPRGHHLMTTSRRDSPAVTFLGTELEVCDARSAREDVRLPWGLRFPPCPGANAGARMRALV